MTGKHHSALNILGEIPDAVIAFNAEFQVAFFNPAAEILFGLSASQAKDLYIEPFIQKIGIDIAATELLANLRENRSWRGQAMHKLPDDRTIPTSWSVSRCELGPNTDGVLAIVRESSHSQVSEQAQLAHQQTFSDLFHFSPIGLALSTLKDGRYLDVNAEALRIYGASRDEMIGKTAFDLGVWMDPASRAEIVSLLRSKGIVRNLEINIRLKSGRLIPMLFSATTMEINGEICMLSSAQDITLRKQAEEEKQKLEERLWQARKAESLTRMAGAIAHKFNNQLAAVMGNLELALQKLPDEASYRQNLQKALVATRHSAETSGLMLTYIGQREIEGEPIDISDVCRKRLPLLQNKIEGIDYELNLMKTGPVVSATVGQIQQVVTHLISNAEEAIGKNGGRITLKTKTVPKREVPSSNLTPAAWKPVAEHYGCIEVTDTGCGIAKDDMDKIFDPFFSTKLTGRGLGLAVIQGIARQWEGAINLKSNPDEGTSFCVFFPLSNESPLPAPVEDQVATPMPKSGRILLVDDEVVVRETTEALLRYLGYSVLAAPDGRTAIELFRRHQGQIRCVITDLTMPGMGGLEIIAVLRQINDDIPIILASGYTEARIKGSGVANQPQAFLHKPYALVDLKAALAKAMSTP